MAEDQEQAAPAEAASRLTDPDWTEGVETERRPGLLAEISNAMVGLKKEFYGKGPTKAKTYINDNYVFTVLEGGLGRDEETLVAAGQADEVRRQRLVFQEAMTKPTTEAVEQLTGRRVLGYHSQIVFDPAVTVEFFVLDEPLD